MVLPVQGCFGGDGVMKNGFLLFLGLFAAIGLSWAGIVLGSFKQLGALAPYYDDTESQAFPQRLPGIASRGQLVYRDLNCASCHTQQVRRPGFGSDQARGWGDRQSVARDYIYQPWPQLGQSRIGPDLTNLQSRKPTAPDEEDLMEMLYAGQGAMPAYKFLFVDRVVVGQVSDHALALTGSRRPAEGHEIVPTSRALALVAYLQSLNTGYDYPEAKPFTGGGEPK
jgi:cytochrome c oxidase cbb3-type subunit 2